MNTKVISVKPIAAFIHEEHVMLWLDTPEGWTILKAFSLLDKEGRVGVAREMLKALPGMANRNMKPDGTIAENMLVVELGKTSLPPHLPKDSIIGMSSEFTSDPGIPRLGEDGRLE